jgi:FKBP-type peptidyl-prolyl cis-trans isomerase
MSRIRLLALALLTVGFTACLDATQPKYATVEETTFDPSLGVDLAASQSTEVGVYYRDIVVGTGPVIASGQDNFMFYRAFLSTGAPIDSIQPPDAPKAFRIGASSLIPGFEIGLQGMRVGSTRQILVPPALAYGLGDLRGPDNTVLIPGNSVLVFVVQLVNADGSTGATTAP